MVEKAFNEFLTVGRVVDAFGVKGEVKIRSFTEAPENLLQFSCWSFDNRSGNRFSCSVLTGRLHGKLIVASLDGIMTRDQALALKGHDILIPTDSLPELPEGEFYHFQLQGLQVKDINGHDYGRVEEIMQTGANDVLVTKGTTTSLVPYIPDVIQQVDLESGIIYVQWQTEI